VTGGFETEESRTAPVRTALLWGIAAQFSSSATNLALSVFAGRALGPSGLGVVFIGFAALQVVQALTRSVLVQPLIAHTAARPKGEREQLAGVGVTVAVLIGVGATALLGAVAALVRDSSLREALLLFAPWIVPSLLHELWKAVLFQEGKGGRAAASEAARLAVMVGATPLVLGGSSYRLVAIWGIGSLVALAIASASYRIRPRAPRSSIVAWRDAGWELGRWLGARELAFQSSGYATTIVLALVIGTAGVGGLRSAEVLFSPFSFVAAALAFPALPLLVRAADDSFVATRRLALVLSSVATLLGLAYFVVMIISRSWLLPQIFGSEFEPFASLVWPMGTAQLFHSVGFGFVLWLTASKRGRAAFENGLLWAVSSLTAATGLAVAFGTTGAAWGMTIAAAVAALAAIAVALRRG
jgi:O-antigen/teichoic acid export membrane protein